MEALLCKSIAMLQINTLIQALDSGNEEDLVKCLVQNPEQKSMSYWLNIITNYLTKNNKLEELHNFEVFATFKEDIYGDSILKFFCILKEEKQFDYLSSLGLL